MDRRDPGARGERGGEPSLATPRRRLWSDRAAAGVIRLGGVTVVVSILAILLFLVVEIAPLFQGARLEAAEPISRTAAPPTALLLDEHRTHVASLGPDGEVRVERLEDGSPVARTRLPPLTLVGVDAFGSALGGVAADGRAFVVPVAFRIGFREQTRVVTPEPGAPTEISLDAGGMPVRALAFRHAADRTTVAVQLASGAVWIHGRSVEENLFTGEQAVSATERALDSAPPFQALVLDPAQRFLYGGTQTGELWWWDLKPRPARHGRATVGVPVTALELLIDGRSLVVGGADGSVSVWFLTPTEAGPPRLSRIRDFPRHTSAIRLIAPSQRDRSFLVQDGDGTQGLYYSTSGRTLWRGRSPLPAARALAFAPKGNGAVLADTHALVPVAIDNPHPEVSVGALFGKVWYEGFAEPRWIWQSSSGDDEFEAKLSLTPLLSGTLKGTLYALLLAVPLGVLGAMYTSQFMHPRLQRVVKPTVELMAALPSVVLGFLAGLWLAPRLEQHFPTLLLAVGAVPAAALAGGWLWERLPGAWRGRRLEGTEVGWMALVLTGAIAACVVLDDPAEAWLFAGSFPAWLDHTTGLHFDQRNAIVVGIAMGFAVIPIVFAIAEDAFSNVPRELAAGARALGANRWQAVTQVVLPTASPGIFSAIMVGFGRAVGETMIVLMATGNTPILSWSPFNGFRTLSANIAVEIPEAPAGGTLYRTLFVAALLLFALTFLVNTAAEIVRHRLRQRYARL